MTHDLDANELRVVLHESLARGAEGEEDEEPAQEESRAGSGPEPAAASAEAGAEGSPR